MTPSLLRAEPPLETVGGKSQPPSFAEVEETPPENVVFSFLRGLPEAQVERRKKGKSIGGRWNEKGFQFEDSDPGVMEIFAHEQTTVSGKNRGAVWMLAKSGSESSLAFLKVPPGRSLRFFYALPDYVFEPRGKAQPAFVQVEILIGKKKVFEGQTNTKGWKEKTLDLTLPYLLQRDYQITIRVRSLDPEPRYFVFYGYIQ